MHEVVGPALVLGSAQKELPVRHDLARARGVDIARRRSGGGAVWLEPGGSVWVDLVIGRDDPLWDDDVTVAFGWVGRAWQRALADLGHASELHERSGPRGGWAQQVCFAGVGAGELTVAGRKVLGVSQRRTRSAARFQTLLLVRWDPEPLVELLALAEGLDELRAVAAGVPVDPAEAVAALVAQLPTR